MDLPYALKYLLNFFYLYVKFVLLKKKNNMFHLHKIKLSFNESNKQLFKVLLKKNCLKMCC